MKQANKQGEQKGLGANDIKREARSRTKSLLLALRAPINKIQQTQQTQQEKIN
jgi:hypothetical protein